MNAFLRIALRISAALAPLAAMISCSKDTIVLSNCYTMGTVLSDNAFRTDENLIFNIVEGKNCYGIGEGVRIFVKCDVLSDIPGKKEAYDVRTSAIAVADAALDLSSGETGWQDAILISDAWISGGYLNMYCAWIHHRNSILKHRTGLLRETSEALGDTLSFIVCHDGHGEGFNKDTDDISKLEITQNFVTFPIEDYLIPGNVTIKLKFKWHKSDGQVLHPETEEHSIKCSIYSPEASPSLASLTFPASPASPSTKAMISPLATLLP